MSESSDLIKFISEVGEITGGTAATAIGAVWITMRYLQSSSVANVSLQLTAQFDKERTELLGVIADLRQENEALRKRIGTT